MFSAEKVETWSSGGIKIIATFFGVGYAPVAQGTLAALAVLPVYYLVRGNSWLFAGSTIFLIILGFSVSGRAERIFGKKDASQVTIDDASGMLLALFLIPQRPAYIIAAFILFRMFDILKVPPAKRLEGLKGSPGIMLDDIVAGIYANLILQTIRYALYAIR